MKMRTLLRAALLVSALAAASACGPTSAEPGQPDAGPVDTPTDAGPGSDKTPTGPDADGDGLVDALEDKNANGRLDDGETDAHSKDSDCDGLLDGPGAGGVPGEDQNANGVVDVGETNPRVRDSDGDGLTDGVERGATANVEPGRCASVTLDADPGTTTDPTRSDSDGDGIADGAEDADQDGAVDAGELDPKNGTDGTGPAAQACTADKLRPVAFRAEGDADLQLALPAAPRFAELSDIVVGGTKVGFMGYDSASQVAFLVYRQAAPGTNPTADEASLRAKLATPGALSFPTTQSFTTWDGYAALAAKYDQAGSADLKARANALANALLGSGAGSLSTSSATGANGPFRLQAEYVHRSDQSLVVLVALTPQSQVTSPATPLFTVNDLSEGASLAQFADTTAAQCETFHSGNAKVDFLFVVDDSGSMASKQNALGSAATAMAEQLGNSTLDWRVALVTSQYHVSGGPNSGLLRGFTRDINTFKSWLTANPSCTDFQSQCGSGGVCRGSSTGWVGICGSGAEGILGAARKATDDLTPGLTGEPAGKLRADATLVVVLLGDADDQTTGYTATVSNCNDSSKPCVPASDFEQFFLATGATSLTKNKLDKPITVHGIVCPVGQGCGEYNPNPQKHAAVMTATGGIRGDILVANDSTGELTKASIQRAMADIVADSIGKGGYRLKKAPIGPSIKVALAAVQDGNLCTAADIPRSRVNGFDFDGSEGSISFYGACRAPEPNTPAAVSYRYWVDSGTDADGKPPCVDDPRYDPNETDHCQGNYACSAANACLCQAPAGGCPVGLVFDSSASVCACVPQLG